MMSRVKHPWRTLGATNVRDEPESEQELVKAASASPSAALTVTLAKH